MSMMLLMMFAAAGAGLVFKRFGRRESLICAGIAASLTLMYYFRPFSMT